MAKLEIDMTLNVDVCWITGRITPEEELDTFEHTWQLQGVFRTEQAAKSACKDDLYFIGPVLVGVSLPHDRTEWPGCYFPLRADI